MVKFALNLPTKFLDDCKKLDLMGLIAYQPGIPAKDFEEGVARCMQHPLAVEPRSGSSQESCFSGFRPVVMYY